MSELKKLKGTEDIFFPEISLWQEIEKIAREVAYSFAFKEIRTPVIEYTDVFKRAIGEATDVVSKEMFEFSDRGGRHIALRPEGTASVVRAFVENRLARTINKRFFYLGSMFRAENPQKGRQRQFHQLGIEIFGDNSAMADLDSILFNVELFRRLGATNYELSLNSIGCPDCRPNYIETLKKYLEPNLKNMCDNCKERFHTNPLRVLDCKKEKCTAINSQAPSILENLCESCDSHFKELLRMLKSLDVEYIIDPTIVRGLDYYSKTAFEFIFNDSGLGSQNTVCGGGRYDALISHFDPKNPLPGVGSAIGLERLLIVLKHQKSLEVKDHFLDYYIIVSSNLKKESVLPLFMKIRQSGYSALMDSSPKNFMKKIKEANKRGSRFALIFGEDEEKDQKISVKNMDNGEQKTLKIEDFLNSISKGVENE